MYLLCEKTNKYIYLLVIFETTVVNKEKEKNYGKKKND
jgi:hypothetical protein